MRSDNGWCWAKRAGGTAGALVAAAALAVFLVACSNDASGPRNPQPDINLLSPAEVAQGRGALTLIVHGTDFVSGSVVRVNGRSRETEFVSDMELRAELPAADFTAAGTAQIVVHNPAPGGGSSSVAGLAITAGLVVGTPEITVLPSRGATMGSPDYTLHIHGRGFVPESVVRWNGRDRLTQYINGERLTATIFAADVAQPGTAQITIVNPGGSTVSPATVTIRSVGSSVVNARVVPLVGRDLAYEPQSRRLYASVPGSASANANSIVEIDPVAGTITRSVVVGSEPGKIALCGNAACLYVALNGASAVRRVDLPALAPALQWSVGAGLLAYDLEVLPGLPNTVAVSRLNSGYAAGVAIYDNGVARPISAGGFSAASRIEFLESASVLYGFNSLHTSFDFHTIGIDEAGARNLATTHGLIGGFFTTMVGVAGRIYGNDGSIVDAERRVKIGSFPSGTAITVDAGMGRAYVLHPGTFPGNWHISVFDLNHRALLGFLSFNTPDYPPLSSTRLLRWGEDGLAFLDETRLFLIQSPIIGP